MRFTVILNVDSKDVPPNKPLDFMAWFSREDFLLIDASVMPKRGNVHGPKYFQSPANPEEELPTPSPAP